MAKKQMPSFVEVPSVVEEIRRKKLAPREDWGSIFADKYFLLASLAVIVGLLGLLFLGETGVKEWALYTLLTVCAVSMFLGLKYIFRQ